MKRTLLLRLHLQEAKDVLNNQRILNDEPQNPALKCAFASQAHLDICGQLSFEILSFGKLFQRHAYGACAVLNIVSEHV